MSIIVNSMWGFVFALMKCSYAAFGEQNKTDNDSKCQQVYKSLKKVLNVESRIGYRIEQDDGILYKRRECRSGTLLNIN
jgi:hypothetical protein